MTETALGSFIKSYLAGNVLTINDLAKTMDVPHTTVARWVKGITKPSLPQLTKLADATNTDLCTLVYLYTGREWQGLKARALAIGSMANKLPDDRLDLAERVLRGILAQQNNDSLK